MSTIPIAPDAEAAPRRLGPFTVRAEPARADAFRIETGGGAARDVPFTFPVVWLARADVHAVAAQMIGTAGWVPIHESQSFDYKCMLARDLDYQMTVGMTLTHSPSRLHLCAEIMSHQQDVCLRMDMVLRIVMTAALDGSSEAC